MKTLFNTLAVLVFISVSHAAAQDKTPKNGAAAYNDFAEPWRSRFTKDWENEVESTKKNIEVYKERALKARKGHTNLRSGQTRATVSQYNLKQAEKCRKRLPGLEKNDPPYFKSLGWIDKWNVGDYGACGYIPLIFQVVGNDRVLLGNESQGSLLMLKVGSTAGLVDGRYFSFGSKDGKFVHVTSTTTYNTVIGGTRTVLAAELLDLDSLKKEKIPAKQKCEEENART